MLMGKHSHFTPQKNPTWKEANRKGRVRANPRFLSTVPNKRGTHDTQCNYSCKKPILPEMLGDREMGGPHPSKEDSPSDPCSRAPSLTQTQTKLPTVHSPSSLFATPKEQRQQGILYLSLSLALPSSWHQTLHSLCPVLPPLLKASP